MRDIVVVQGMQYGSEAKGSVSAAVARGWRPDTVVTAWGPNAGHTVHDAQSGIQGFVSSMLASSALYPSTGTILIGPGSVVDIQKLTSEIDLAGSRLLGKLLVIHPQAAVLKEMHAELEHDLLRIGSTMKGTMRAAINKMQRNETAVVRGCLDMFDNLLLVASKHGLKVSFSERVYDVAIDASSRLLVEGAQGFSLGMHGQFYPYCTSRDVSTAQVLADCRVPYPFGEMAMCVIGVCRTYPIRVANRIDPEDGQQFTSGGIYEDQHELDWERDMGRKPELTTVTKLPRRIFSFSHEQIRQAARVMRPSVIALTFCDYVEAAPEDGSGFAQAGLQVQAMALAIQDTIRGSGYPADIESVSYGPDLVDMYHVADENFCLDTNLYELSK